MRRLSLFISLLLIGQTAFSQIVQRSNAGRDLTFTTFRDTLQIIGGDTIKFYKRVLTTVDSESGDTININIEREWTDSLSYIKSLFGNADYFSRLYFREVELLLGLKKGADANFNNQNQSLLALTGENFFNLKKDFPTQLKTTNDIPLFQGVWRMRGSYYDPLGDSTATYNVLILVNDQGLGMEINNAVQKDILAGGKRFRFNPYHAGRCRVRDVSPGPKVWNGAWVDIFREGKEGENDRLLIQGNNLRFTQFYWQGFVTMNGLLSSIDYRAIKLVGS